MDTLKVPLTQRRNARLFIFGGLLIIALSIALLYIPDTAVSLIASFFIILAYIGLRIGFAKTRLPRFGLVICHDHLQFHHRYGGWSLPWHSIKRFGIPSVGRGFEMRELGFIGIRLDNYHTILDTISPRLCAHLLTEQRAALLVALRSECSSGSCVSDDLLEDNYYTAEDGRIYHGLLAMFALRMKKLRELTGYDLLIDQSVINDDPQHFISLLRRYQAHGVQPEVPIK